MNALILVTVALVFLALGYAAGIASVQPPPPMVKPTNYRPAGLQLSCSKGDLEELRRVCRARARMEKVGK